MHISAVRCGGRETTTRHRPTLHHGRSSQRCTFNRGICSVHHLYLGAGCRPHLSCDTMPRSMTRWIDRTFRSSVNPPACPQRTCTLTPSPSSESLLDATAAATANSDFFQRLPYEVRRFILIDAFGGRILHMELKYDHPDMPLEKRAQDPELSSFHAYIGMPKQQEKRVEGWKPKQWQWQSTVCHRFSPRYVLRVPTVAQPHDDSCYSGEHIWCSAWPGEDMRKCLIGVMGWLLTCRQAYVIRSLS